MHCAYTYTQNCYQVLFFYAFPLREWEITGWCCCGVIVAVSFWQKNMIRVQKPENNYTSYKVSVGGQSLILQCSPMSGVHPKNVKYPWTENWINFNISGLTWVYFLNSYWTIIHHTREMASSDCNNNKMFKFVLLFLFVFFLFFFLSFSIFSKGCSGKNERIE